MSIRENIETLIKGFAFLFKIEKQYAFVHVITSILSPLKPYINIYMTAVIINAIERSKAILIVMCYAFLTVVLNFLFDLILAYLNRKKTLLLEQFNKNEQMFFAKHSMSMKYKFLEDANVYNLKERVKSESQSGYNMFFLNMFSGQLISSISSIVVAATLGVELFIKSNITPLFKIVIFIVMSLAIVINYYTTKTSNKKNMDMFNGLVSYNKMFNFFSEYNENYNAGKDIRIYSMGTEIAQRLSALNSYAGEIVLKTKMSIVKYVFLQIISSEVLNCFVYIFVILVCLNGGVGIGDITKYVSSIMLLVSGFSSLIRNFQSLINNNDYLKTYFSYFDIPEEHCLNEKKKIKKDEKGYTIEFKGVSFAYPNTNQLALKNISFIINPGEKIAVVGKNGSGKTTMIKLLCRLYKPDIGEILINGQNIQDFDYNDYIKILSVVFQDYKLFSFTLSENIVLAEEKRTNDLYSAIEKAGLDKFVQDNYGGVDTVLYRDFDERGIEISGGEGQKVAMARALYRAANIYILDEPTAALDPVAENEIYRKFNSIVNDKTAIFISHRMAACTFCDKVLVFQDGELVQNGSHYELLKEKNKIYYELWSSQSMYFN